MGQKDPFRLVEGYCCTRVLLYAKILKETETEKKQGFFALALPLAPLSLIGLPTKLQNKKNTTFLALLQLFFALEKTKKKLLKAYFKTFIDD